jgi:hypothetical protein
MKGGYLGFAALVAAAAAAPAAAQQQQAHLERNKSLGLSITTGADYSVGKYGGTIDTKILVVPFSLRAKTGPFRFSVTLPWLRIDGPANIVGGGEGGPIVIDPNGPRSVRQGLGDVSLGATYSLPASALGGFDVDIGGRVKLPTADRSKGLSTGKTDLTATLDVSRTIGTATPFVTLGYRMPGKPAGLNLRNSVTTSVGSSFVLGKSLIAIASYDYSGRTSALSYESHSLFGALAGNVTKRLLLTGYGTLGLSRGAPDYGLGLLLTVKAF